jgi:hypothetical protein
LLAAQVGVELGRLCGDAALPASSAQQRRQLVDGQRGRGRRRRRRGQNGPCGRRVEPVSTTALERGQRGREEQTQHRPDPVGERDLIPGRVLLRPGQHPQRLQQLAVLR